MRIAVMQPYLFPYIGYFQLLHAVDKFIVYDDVTFIKQGWINRNNILLNQKPFLFTIPLANASSNALICDTLVSDRVDWRVKFVRTLEQAYKKAPYYKAVSRLIVGILGQEDRHISSLATRSIEQTARYLGMATTIQPTSGHYGNSALTAQDRVVDICKKEHADHYINPISGMALYSPGDFNAAGIRLNFIKTREVGYAQFGNPFVPSLSILDVLMFNTPDEVMDLMGQYDLI